MHLTENEMRSHQVLTGAANHGDRTFGVGNVNGNPFTAYSSGCNIVILSEEFDKVQIISAVASDFIDVSCVDCSIYTGCIACAYADNIIIFEPKSVEAVVKNASLNYDWSETAKIKCDCLVSTLAWGNESWRLLSAGQIIQIWQHSNHRVAQNDSNGKWSCIWKTPLASPVALLSSSPDATLFMTSGISDRLVRVWYQYKPFECFEEIDEVKIDYRYIYLAHPRSVTAFSWRATSRYMPNGIVCNMLVTSCLDNICRIWCETVLPEDASIASCDQLKVGGGGGGFNHHIVYGRNDQSANFVQRIKNIRRLNQFQDENLASLMPSTLSRHDCHPMRNGEHFHLHSTMHFHLAASINAISDIPMVPTLLSSSFDVRRGASGQFVMHWLDNKVIQFDETFKRIADNFIGTYKGTEEDSFKSNLKQTESNTETLIEDMYKEWHQKSDLLFAIHPLDGSLLVWAVDYLDEFHPGSFRQAQVRFSSRIPNAISIGDASSMVSHVALFQARGRLFKGLTSKKNLGISVASSSNIMLSLITKHTNGSLNLWKMTYSGSAGNSGAQQQLLNITHESRVSGHRFHIRCICPHPVLPLCISTSHRSQNLNNDRSHLGDLNTTDYCSELIVWRSETIEPLSHSDGGLIELARINSAKKLGFVNVAWFPTLLKSYDQDVSPSVCFVAYEGDDVVRIYQLIIDARSLLVELEQRRKIKRKRCSSSEEDDLSFGTSSKIPTRHSGASEFSDIKIASTQSTSKPGVVIELNCFLQLNLNKGTMTDFRGIFLHIYPEFMISNLISNDSEVNYVVSGHLGNYKQNENGSRKFLFNIWRLEVGSTYNSSAELGILSSGSVTPEPTADILPDIESLPAVCAFVQHVKFIPSASNLPLSQDVEVLQVVSSASHLASEYIYPPCQPSYILATLCSDDTIRFWCLNGNEENDSNIVWAELLMEGESSLLNISGKPLGFSIAYCGRVSCVYIDLSSSASPVLKVSIYEYESSGGSNWTLEESIQLTSTDIQDVSHLKNNTNIDICETESEVQLRKSFVDVNWTSVGNTSHILTVSFDKQIILYGCLKGLSTLSNEISWVKVANINSILCSGELSKSIGCVSWVKEGILVCSIGTQMIIYSQWFSTRNERCKQETSTSLKDKEVMNFAMGNFGLFGLVQKLSVQILPQYHPYQLVELLNSGKISWVKAILSHLVRCIKCPSGRNPSRKSSRASSLAINDIRSPRSPKSIRFLNRKFSIGLEDDTKLLSTGVFEEATTCLDYEQLYLIPPISMWTLLQTANTDRKVNHENEIDVDNNQGHSQLFSVPSSAIEENLDVLLASDDDVALNKDVFLEEFDEDEDMDVGNEPQFQTINRTFGLRQSRQLSKALTVYSLPGLSSLDQMHLMALADTMASCNVDDIKWHSSKKGPKSSLNHLAPIQQQHDHQVSLDSLDDCGLRFLLAMKHFGYLLRCLPASQRSQLRKSGLDSSFLVWGFHSESEAELVSLIPCVSKGTPNWSELRELGVVWWIRSTSILKGLIEKVAKQSFYVTKDPLDAAIFYLAMQKKNLVWGLFRSIGDTRMTEFFSHNFAEERWRKAALKNAFVLMGKQRFVHAASFFILSGSIKQAVDICIDHLQDFQLAMLIARLYQDKISMPDSLHSLLTRYIIMPADGDPFLRSMSYWMTGDYIQSLSTLIQSKDNKLNPKVFNFYVHLRKHPLIMRQKRTANVEHCQEDTEMSPLERKLFFSTAYFHLKSGCPLLAVEVLSKLPLIKSSSKSNMASTFHQSADSVLESCHDFKEKILPIKDDAILDWTQQTVPVSEDLDDGGLKLEWSDDEDEIEPATPSEPQVDKTIVDQRRKRINYLSSHKSLSQSVAAYGTNDSTELIVDGEGDQLALQLQFVCCLKLLMEDMEALVSPEDIRPALFVLLEHGVEVIKKLCAYDGLEIDTSSSSGWISAHHDLLYKILTYCTLQCRRNYGLSTIRLELLFLLNFHGDDKVECQGMPPLVTQYLASQTFNDPLAYLIVTSRSLLTSVGDLFMTGDDVNGFIGRNRCEGLSLSSCLYQSLCLDITRSSLSAEVITSEPSKWPGVPLVRMHIDRHRDDQGRPEITVFLCEIFVAVYLSLFMHALSICDAHILFRLVGQTILAKFWADIFGGGTTTTDGLSSQNKPLREEANHGIRKSSEVFDTSARFINTVTQSLNKQRVKLNIKSVLGLQLGGGLDSNKKEKRQFNGQVSMSNKQCILYRPPESTIVAKLMIKPGLSNKDQEIDYDSDVESVPDTDTNDFDDMLDEDGNLTIEGEAEIESPSNSIQFNSFAWMLIKIACLKLAKKCIQNFVTLAGVELTDLAVVSPVIYSSLCSIDVCITRLESELGNPPDNFISWTPVDSIDGSVLDKYSFLSEFANTPFA